MSLITLISIIFIFISGAGSPWSPPQAQAQETTPAPLNNLKNRLETPVDLLHRTLQQAKDIEKESWEDTSLSTEFASPSEEFIDPFIPKIPKAPKPVPQAAQSPTPERAPTAQQVAPAPQFTVSGLVWNSPKPTAIVNDQVVYIGDAISDWQIAEITKEGVKVVYEEQSLWVKPVVNPTGGQQTRGRNFR